MIPRKRRATVSLQLIGVLCVALLVVFIVLPIAMEFYSTLGGFESFPTLEYYSQAIRIDYLMVLLNTLLLSTITALVSVSIGTAFAWAISRTNMAWKGVIENTMLLPYYLPPLVGAIAWLLILSPTIGIVNILSKYFFSVSPFNILGFTGMVLVMSIYFVPFTFVYVSSALKNMDPSLEEASSMMGASNFRTVINVTLPIVMPSILSAFLMTFLFSTHSLAIPAVIGAPARFYVLSSTINDLFSGVVPRLNVAAVLCVELLMITILGLFLQRRMLRSREFLTVTGKGHRANLIDLKRLKHLVGIICIGYIIVSTGLPIVALAIASLQGYIQTDLSKMTFSLDNFVFVFSNPLMLKVFANTLFLASFCATVTVLIGIVVSHLLIRSKIRGRKILDYLSTLPVGIPHISFAIAILILWIRVPMVYGTIWILVIAYIGIFTPYAVRSISSVYRQIGPELEEGSRMSGASWLTTLSKISLPLMKHGIIGAWLLVFIDLMKDISIGLFLVSYGSETMSVMLFRFQSEGSYSQVAALALVQTLIVFVALSVARYVFKAKMESA